MLQGVGWSESHLGLSPPKRPVFLGCQALRLAQGRPGASASAWEEGLGGGGGEPHALRDVEPLRLHAGGPHSSGGGRAHAHAARDCGHPRDVAWEACHFGPSEPSLRKRLCLRNWWTDRTVQRCRHSLPCWQVGAHCQWFGALQCREGGELGCASSQVRWIHTAARWWFHSCFIECVLHPTPNSLVGFRVTQFFAGFHSSFHSRLAAGTHPLCCQGDYVVMEAVDFVIRTLAGVQQQHPYPIAPWQSEERRGEQL